VNAIATGLIDSDFDLQSVLGPNVTAYCGCVGDDDSAAKPKAENEKAGVESVYMINPREKTGSCAVLLTSGNHFSTPKRGTFALCIRPLRGVNRARSHGRLCPKWGVRGLRDLHDPALG